MIGELSGQIQHTARHGVGSDGDVVHGAVVLTDDACGHLPGLSFAEQSCGRLDRLTQCVIGHDPPRVGVVGGNRGFTVEQFVGELLGVTQLFEAFTDTFGEFGRGLTGEGQSKDLFGADIPIGHQPHHTRGHGLALARTRSCDDHSGFQGRGDDLGLFGRGFGSAEEAGQFCGGEFGVGVGVGVGFRHVCPRPGPGNRHGRRRTCSPDYGWR